MKIKYEYKDEILGLSETVKKNILRIITKIEYVEDITPKEKPSQLPPMSVDSSGYKEQFDYEKLEGWGVISVDWGIVNTTEGRSYVYPFSLDKNKLKEVKELLKESLPDEKIGQPVEQKLDIFKDWEITEKDNRAYLKERGETRFVFPTNWSLRYKYFKYLFQHPGEIVEYRTLYESLGGSFKFPDVRGRNWRVNDLVRRAVHSIVKQSDFKKLPFTIIVRRGFILVPK